MGSPNSPPASAGSTDDALATDRVRAVMEAAQSRPDAEEKTQGNQFAPGQMRAWLEAIRIELGGDPELIKQAFADLNAEYRQELFSTLGWNTPNNTLKPITSECWGSGTTAFKRSNGPCCSTMGRSLF